MAGSFRLGSGGSDDAKFGSVVDNPAAPIAPATEVGPPNADDIPPAVVGMPSVETAPDNDVGTPPPTTEDIPPTDIEGELNVGTAMDVPLFAIVLSEVCGLKETDGAENIGSSDIC